MNENERLSGIVSRTASEYGFTEITADFTAKKEFTVSWKIRNKTAEIHISDYLKTAPDDVLMSFSRSVLDLMTNRKPKYEDIYMSWITSDSFINSNRKTYLKRSKNLSETEIGSHRNLMDSVDRLLDMDLLHPSDIENSVMVWTKHPNIRRLGWCSSMMRVVAISSALDSPDVPDYAADYVVYHECLHLRQGYRPFVRAHDSRFREYERRYPMMKESEIFLKKLNNSAQKKQT